MLQKKELKLHTIITEKGADTSIKGNSSALPFALIAVLRALLKDRSPVE